MRALVTALVAAAMAAIPIPSDNGSTPAFTGTPATPHPVSAPAPPRHPFMAPNERSNLHDDAYQTDTYQGIGPLGRNLQVVSTLFSADCGSVTFDAHGRIVTVCVGIAGPTLRMLDPETLDTLAEQALPPRDPRTLANLFTSFGGGGYFYLDNEHRAVVPTTTRHVQVFAETPAPGFALVRDIDLSGVIPDGESIISALPTGRGASGSPRRAASSATSPPAARSCRGRWANRSAIRSRSTRRAACTSSATPRCTASRPVAGG